MRRIALNIASINDLKQQCRAGLEYLKTSEEAGLIVIVVIMIASIHRNSGVVRNTLRQLSSDDQGIDVLITMAGWANHLTGCSDAYLRYDLNDPNIHVIGVAAGDPGSDDPDVARRTLAAKLSITEVPGTQVIFNDFIGAEGFLAACKHAVEGELPPIKLPKPVETHVLTLDEALELAA